jgi:hypothetical protein
MNPALVVISHYNAWPTDQLVGLLDQIRKIPSGYPFRCLVVVNQAVDGPLELPAAHADVEVLYRENTGYNIGAWEHGWRSAPRADYYLFLQEECRILRPDWLGSFVRQLSRSNVGLVGESLAYQGLSWRRLDHFMRFNDYEAKPGEPPLRHFEGVRRFLKSKGVPVGWTGEHLQSLVIAMRREVLEAIDGFMIGDCKGDAIACEIGITRAAAAKGFQARQIGLLPFRYISHPQWGHGDLGVYLLMINWVERFAPLSKAEVMRKAVFKLREILSRPAARPASGPGE